MKIFISLLLILFTLAFVGFVVYFLYYLNKWFAIIFLTCYVYVWLVRWKEEYVRRMNIMKRHKHE